MIRTHLLVSLGSIALAIGLVVPSARAQTGGVASSGPRSRAVAPASRGVAVIDIHRVFMQYSRFTSAMNALKRDLEAADAETKRKLESISVLVEEVRQFEPGTAQYKEREKAIVRARSDVQVGVELKRKDFAEAEATIYYSAYQEVTSAIRDYAEYSGYSLVLRTSGGTPKQNQPAQVLQHVNRAVVWVSPNNDITDRVISYLAQRHGPVTEPLPGGAPREMTQRNSTVPRR